MAKTIEVVRTRDFRPVLNCASDAADVDRAHRHDHQYGVEFAMLMVQTPPRYA
jgi:hypothetical protein